MPKKPTKAVGIHLATLFTNAPLLYHLKTPENLQKKSALGTNGLRKTLLPLWVVFHCLKAAEPLQGSGTHLIDIGRMTQKS